MMQRGTGVIQPLPRGRHKKILVFSGRTTKKRGEGCGNETPWTTKKQNYEKS